MTATGPALVLHTGGRRRRARPGGVLCGARRDPADCPGCGHPTRRDTPARLAAAALVGPHPVITDVACPRCPADVGQPCLGCLEPGHVHRTRHRRWQDVHASYGMLLLNLADAAADLAAGRSSASAMRCARGHHERLTARTPGSGVVFRFPTGLQVRDLVRHVRHRSGAVRAGATPGVSDPVVAAVIEHVVTVGGTWTGTASDLLAALTLPAEPGVVWPGDARALSVRLKRAAGELEAAGVTVTAGRSNGARRLTVACATPAARAQ